MRKHGLVHALFIALMVVALAGCSKSPEQKRQEYLKSAREYADHKRYDEACIQYQNALKIAPDDVKALISLGETRLKLKHSMDAYAAFSRASVADPKDVKSREYLAYLLLLSGRFDMAEKQALSALGIDPKDARAKEILAQARFMGGKRDQGIKTMEELVASGSPKEEEYYNLIEMYMTAGRGRDALALVTKGAALFPKSFKMRFLASDIHSFMKDTAGARKWAEEAYRVSGGDEDAGLSLANFYALHHLDALYQSQLSAIKQKYPGSADPNLLESSVLHQKHDLDGALKAARKALELKGTTKVRIQIGQLLLEKNDAAQAKKILEEAIGKDPDDLQAKVILAQIFVEEKDQAKAMEMISKPLKAAPMNPTVVYVAAQAYLLKGDVKKARELVEVSLKSNKQSVQLHKVLAKIYFIQGMFKDALVEVNLLVKNSIKNPETMYIGALSALRTSNPAGAAPFVEHLRQSSPDAWMSLEVQAQYALAQHDRKGAFAIAGRAVTLYPQNDGALDLYAFTAPGNVEMQKAIERLNDICSKSDSAGCRIALSRLLEQAGKKDEALSEINKAMGMEPGKPALHDYLAQFYARNGMLKASMEEYEKILKKYPGDLRAANMLARMNQQGGNSAKAREYYKYILDRNPKNGLAANNMAWLLATGGKKEELELALHYAQTAKEIYPEDPWVADTLGYIYLQKGMNGNAMGQFRLALEKTKNDPTILYHAALAMVKAGKKMDAEKLLKKATGGNKAFPEKQQALSLLAQIRG
jgi:tetratricopeptide (TPR) repeat protein